MKRLGLVIGLWSGVCLAQGVSPKVAPFPLKVRQAPQELTGPARLALQAEYVRLLRDAKVQSPTTYDINDALVRTKRQDCDVDDGCLTALAVVTDSLYALYAEVNWDLRETVTASGRVVRSDGVVIVPTRSVSVKFGKKDTFAAAAKQALEKLVVEELGVIRLPAAKPTEAAVVKTSPVDAGTPAPAPAPADAGVTLPPPPPPPVAEAGPPAGKIIGFVLAGVGGASAVTGLSLFLAGRSDATNQLTSEGVLLPGSDRAVALRAGGQQRTGVGVLVGGLAVAAVGAVVILVSKDEPKPMTWWVAPTPGGAAVGIQGVLP